MSMHMNNTVKTFFAPQLYIRNGIRDITFYTEAFGAKELRRIINDDNTIHVAELEIDGALFHLHEQTAGSPMLNPDNAHGTTVKIGLFVEDVDEVVRQAMKAGASEISPAQDYDYGYRQAQILDPFGHCWMIE